MLHLAASRYGVLQDDRCTQILRGIPGTLCAAVDLLAEMPKSVNQARGEFFGATREACGAFHYESPRARSVSAHCASARSLPRTEMRTWIRLRLGSTSCAQYPWAEQV